MRRVVIGDPEDDARWGGRPVGGREREAVVGAGVHRVGLED